MNKYQLKYYKLLLITVLAFTLQSCLKNNDFYADFSKSDPAVELPIAAKYANGVYLFAFDIADTPSTYYAVVNLASAETLSKPVTGTIAVDQAYLNQYNADNGKTYEVLPDSVYTLSSFDFTIPSGERQFRIPVKISTNKLDLSHQYVLPLTISNSNIKISNWNHLMLNVGTRNQWEGKYTYTAVTSLGDADGETAKMTTVGQYSVTMNLVNYYSNQVVFTVDPLTNKVTVSMTTLLPIATDPSSHWDPDTKTFHVKWTSNNGARTYDETYVKQ